MATYLQIRNVPEATRRALKDRAAARGESVNTYLLDLLAREVERPTVREVLDRAAARSPMLGQPSAELVRTARAERDEELIERLTS